MKWNGLRNFLHILVKTIKTIVLIVIVLLLNIFYSFLNTMEYIFIGEYLEGRIIYASVYLLLVLSLFSSMLIFGVLVSIIITIQLYHSMMTVLDW